MRRDKRLQMIADESIQPLVDEKVRSELHAKQAGVKGYKKRSILSRSRIVMATICMAIVIAVVVPCAVLLPPNQGGNELNFGWSGDSIRVPATIDDVNALFNEYVMDPENVQLISLEQDAQTGMPLNYRITWESADALQGCNIWIIVNPIPDDSILELNPKEEMDVNGIKVKYYIESEHDEASGAYAFSGYADFSLEGYQIYMREYSIITLENNNGLANMITSVFKMK